jgi:hypothetical protein
LIVNGAKGDILSPTKALLLLGLNGLALATALLPRDSLIRELVPRTAAALLVLAALGLSIVTTNGPTSIAVLVRNALLTGGWGIFW